MSTRGSGGCACPALALLSRSVLQDGICEFTLWKGRPFGTLFGLSFVAIWMDPCRIEFAGSGRIWDRFLLHLMYSYHAFVLSILNIDPYHTSTSSISWIHIYIYHRSHVIYPRHVFTFTPHIYISHVVYPYHISTS